MKKLMALVCLGAVVFLAIPAPYAVGTAIREGETITKSVAER